MLRGHAVEARLYAEDVAAGFLPASGPIQWLHWPKGYASIPGWPPVMVSPYYDPMIASSSPTAMTGPRPSPGWRTPWRPGTGPPGAQWPAPAAPVREIPEGAADGPPHPVAHPTAPCPPRPSPGPWPPSGSPVAPVPPPGSRSPVSAGQAGSLTAAVRIGEEARVLTLRALPGRITSGRGKHPLCPRSGSHPACGAAMAGYAAPSPRRQADGAFVLQLDGRRLRVDEDDQQHQAAP